MNMHTKIEEAEPPHNVQAEQALLGAIFINNEAFHRVSEFLEPKHFYEPAHQKIYELFQIIVGAGKAATPVTLKSSLPDDAEVAGLPIASYLARLAGAATSILNARDYGEIVRADFDRRELQRIGKMLTDAAGDRMETMSPAQLIEAVEAELLSLTHVASGQTGFVRFAEYVRDSIEVASKAYQRDGHLSGMPTGISDLDSFMGGLQKSDLIIIAGRPGMGKSAIAANIAYNAANSGLTVGANSLEMSGEQLATRINSERANIPSSRIRRGDISEHEFASLAETASKISGIPLFIDQTGGLSLAQVTSRARRLKRERGLDLLIIDYLQLMNGGARYKGQRTQEVSEITNGLKALAKELDIPIIALSQLSRQVESRDDKRPQLSDLRESGSIEQDADVVLFVYREEYYLKNKEPREGTEEWFKWEGQMRAAEGKAELIIGKQRHGPTGKVEVQFDAHFTRFSNLAHENVVPFNERGMR